METTVTPDSQARERLKQGLAHMVEEAEDLLKNAQRTGSGRLDSAREKFEHQLRRAKDELYHLEASAQRSARRAARATDHAVHEHPYAAMGIVAAVALLAGVLLSRR